ncbi:PA14 domain-containing protein [Streptomyces sp. NPDC058614]|uniref:PA14 domain-containing protein n=1 Tax=Streptomyces sp. NPDC058614 TaxID=3346557 RepID=UPI0036601E99
MNPARPTTAAVAGAVVLTTAAGLLVAANSASAATTCASPVYKRQFYANTTFSGTPKKTDCDAVVNQNWGTGAPTSGLPANNFGVRWTVTRDFGSGGPFALPVESRDGIRVYLDGVRKVDLWKNVSTTQSKTVNVTIPKGTHTLRIDFVNWTGTANVKFAYTPRTSATVDKVKPLVPTAPSVTYDKTTGRAKLTWAKNKELDLAGYRVYRRLKGTAYGTKPLVTTTSTTYTDTTLPKTGDVYYYEVRAHDKAGNASTGTADKPVTTVDTTAPAAPVGLTATRRTASVWLEWQPVGGADWYRVQRAASAEGPFEAVSANLSNASYRDTPSFDTTERWYYRVVAGDAVGNVSAPSVIADTGAPDVTPPAQVQGVSASGSTAGINVRWTANTDDTDHYEVWASVPGEAFPGPAIVFGDSWLDSTASTDTTVEYRVYAVDAVGNTSPVSASVSAVRPVPSSTPAPPSVNTTPHDDGTGVGWTSPGEFTRGYYVYRRLDPNGAWTLLSGSLVTAYGFNDTTAPKGVAYYYVASVDYDWNVSVPSSTATADRLTLATATAPEAPVVWLEAPYTECTANDCVAHGGVGQDVEVRMMWNPDERGDIYGFQLHFSGPGGSGGYPKTTWGNYTWTPTVSGTYVVEVSTIDVYGRVGPSTSLTFKVA